MNIKRFLILAAVSLSANWLPAESLTLPPERRPDWLSRDGIVMAGSWEPLPFRCRRDGSDGYTPTAEQLAGYQREHSPKMVAELKALGVNFVMMHCYKGGGLAAERESMQDAVRFAKRCHEADLRVGVYNYSGAFIWETFFQEMPQAREWLLLDAAGKPLPYSTHYWRYFWNRNHPEAQAFYRGLVKFAVEDIKTDLIHFDNHEVGPGSDPVSVERFRAYLAERFTPQQREAMKITDLKSVVPPLKSPADAPLRRAWLDFSSQSLAQAYADMSRYARTLRPDILMECNPGGPGEAIRPPVDHGRLLAGGEAFWDEGLPSGYQGGRLQTRIRTYKIGRRMGNVAFAYTTTPLEAAEAMAFNLDCLGCICWFEFGRIVEKPGSEKPVRGDLAPYIRFFHSRRDLLRNAEVIADVAVLRGFASQAFDTRSAAKTAQVEQALIDGRIPFQIIYEHQLGDLGRYRALLLADCTCLSDRHIEQIRSYAASGGRLCVVGAAATHDEWMIPRPKPALDDLPLERATLEQKDGVVAAARKACEGRFSGTVDGPGGLYAEYTRQKTRSLVHLVNYRPDEPAADVRVSLAWPAGAQAAKVTLVSPDQDQDRQIRATRADGTIQFTVPSVRTYAIAAVSE